LTLLLQLALEFQPGLLAFFGSRPTQIVTDFKPLARLFLKPFTLPL
jgi:hypothetical protein